MGIGTLTMMIASMTAFARVSIQEEWGHATWELRSVNHRYLDLSFKLPEYFREWELSWRNMAATLLHRGKIECNLSISASKEMSPSLKVNTDLVEQLLSSCQAIMQYPNVKPTIKAMDLLSWPEVLIADVPPMSHLQEPLTDLLMRALQELVKTREREGEQLKALLETKLVQILEQVAIVKEKLPNCLETQKQKLLHKLGEISANTEPQRLEQELVLYAQRIDVEEEVNRLATHVKEVSRVLKTGQSVGRRLDFLMQELGREANTLAAKALDGNISTAGIELKVLIEQMREQIQNVE